MEKKKCWSLIGELSHLPTTVEASEVDRIGSPVHRINKQPCVFLTKVRVFLSVVGSSGLIQEG